MAHVDYTSEEVVARGEAIYQQRLRAQSEKERFGEFLVLDIESGDYEIAKEDLDASLALLARRPNGVLYGVRIGFPAAYRVGRPCAISE
jgi:hypothetical protein